MKYYIGLLFRLIKLYFRVLLTTIKLIIINTGINISIKILDSGLKYFK